MRVRSYVIVEITMPKYDYRCDANGKVLEVQHSMYERLGTWGDLCARAGADLGDTPADSPVTRLITGGYVVKTAGSGETDAPACDQPACCGGFCDLN
jgi:predicted nucleic acid-binding Zn ribbon protein